MSGFLVLLVIFAMIILNTVLFLFYKRRLDKELVEEKEMHI